MALDEEEPAPFCGDGLIDDDDEDGAVEGEIIVTLNNRPYAFDLTGTLAEGALSLAFDGVNLIVGSIRGIWEGTILAGFD